MLKSIALMAAMATCLAAAEKKVITPEGGPPPVGPYSPGILVGGYLYLSGQGAAKADGTFPAAPQEQTAQCLLNVRRIVEAAGLTMEHVVYAQVYLKDIGAYDAMDRAWREAFPKNPPARAVLGVHRMPTETPVEITAVAIRDLSAKRVVNPSGSISGGVLTADRLYLSGSMGRAGDSPEAQVKTALDGLSAVLKSAGMDFRHVVFVNPYLTEQLPAAVMNKLYAGQFEFGNTPARATFKVASLPAGAIIEFTGVAVRDLSKRKAVRPANMRPSPTASPCVWAGDTLFCSAKSGDTPEAATVEAQLKQSMRSLLDGLEEAGIGFGSVVATNVYLDDLADFTKMNPIYGSFFGTPPPTRTTVQPFVTGDRALEQVSLIAVK